MILALFIILFLLMLIVGGNRGLDSFFALVKTILAMIVNIYLISFGLPAIPVTLCVSILFAGIVLYMQNGINQKMHAAAIAVGLVVVIITLTAGPVLLKAGISGYNEIEQYEEISMYLSSDLSISMGSVALAATVLGLLGAVMDTAVAITTAVNEVYVNNPALSERKLFQSGLNIGKDILGTTVNTLFFAGLGECIMLAVLFLRNDDSFATIINSKSLFQEISGILIGGIGCLLIIPLSSLIMSKMLKGNLKENIYKYIKKNGG